VKASFQLLADMNPKNNLSRPEGEQRR
jgi:hypothetical protein